MKNMFNLRRYENGDLEFTFSIEQSTYDRLYEIMVETEILDYNSIIKLLLDNWEKEEEK